jgi:hypothetical protein
MSGKWSSFTARLLAGLCFLGEALFAQRLHASMCRFTNVHYNDLEQMKFDLLPIQDGLEILYRGLLVLGILWLLLALNAVLDWRK